MTEYSGAFTGGRKVQNFGISNANKGGGDNYQQAIDRLVIVDKYDLANRKIYCTDKKDGRKMIAHIDPIQYARDVEYYSKNSREGYTGPQGHSIDSIMEKEYPVNSPVILKYTKILKKDDGAGFSICEANRVSAVNNPEDDKTFYCLVGVRLRVDEEGQICVARGSLFKREKGIDFNDETEVEAVAKMIDERNSVSSRMVGEFRETLPSYGVQYRALMLSPEKDRTGSDKYIAVNESTLFDWMEGPAGEDGKEIKEQAHLLTGQEFLSYFEDYAAYIESHPKYSAHVKDMRIEAILYESAPASRNKNLRLGSKDDENVKKKLMYKLGSTPCFVDQEQTTSINHDNYVVRGIVQFSANKLEKVAGKPVEIQSYWLNNIHINGFKGSPHAFIRTSDGLKVEVAPELKLQHTPTVEGNASNSTTYGAVNTNSNSSVDTAPKATVNAVPAAKANVNTESDKNDEEGDEDPFAFFEPAAIKPVVEEEEKKSGSGGRRGRFGS